MTAQHLSRRELLGITVLPRFSGWTASRKIPMSLIIDDGAPGVAPSEFTRRVVETFEDFDLRGKFTVIPMPGRLGRIDKSMQQSPPPALTDFLQQVRERIVPRFDITPEFLTHSRAYDLKSGDYQDVREDVWISRAPIEEVVEYFVLAFLILRNVGLEATGITSPWSAGIDVEQKYARALADAQWKLFSRKLTWYFLHTTDLGPPRRCSVECRVPERGQTVVSLPANAPDIFWPVELPTQTQRMERIQQGIDRLLSADGRTGRIRELIESGYPVLLLTHWQSLYSHGSGLGLEGLRDLAGRIQKVFGKDVEWLKCSEVVRRYVEQAAPTTFGRAASPADGVV